MKQPIEFQKFFDHTLLKPDATREEILKLAAMPPNTILLRSASTDATCALQ